MPIKLAHKVAGKETMKTKPKPRTAQKAPSKTEIIRGHYITARKSLLALSKLFESNRGFSTAISGHEMGELSAIVGMLAMVHGLETDARTRDLVIAAVENPDLMAEWYNIVKAAQKKGGR